MRLLCRVGFFWLEGLVGVGFFGGSFGLGGSYGGLGGWLVGAAQVGFLRFTADCSSLLNVNRSLYGSTSRVERSEK